MRRKNPRPRVRQQGSAMMETVMILPLVFVILGLVYFFGNAHQREQQHRILARYDVTRAANMVTPAAPESPVSLQTQQAALNELFLRNRATFVDIEWNGYVSPAGTTLGQWAYQYSQPTGDLATQLFASAPRGTKIKLLAEYTSNINLPEAVDGALLRRSVHPGPSWGFADGLTQDSDGQWIYDRNTRRYFVDRRLRDVFYDTFDRQLDNYTEPASRMVSLIRGMLYAYQPDYRGPTITYIQHQNP